MKALLLALVSIVLFLNVAQAQIQCAASPANYLKDYGFETGSTYCRNSSVDLDVDDITLCVIGYDGKNLTYDLGSSTQINLQTQFAQPGWTSTGQVDVVTGNYQQVHGFWGIKLNGQFAAGSISQTFQVTTSPGNQLSCSSVYYEATNAHAPVNYTSGYIVQLTEQGVGAPIFSEQHFAPPNSNSQAHLLSSGKTGNYTIPGPGTYTLSFISTDTAGTAFNDGLFPTQTYFGRTGAVIDDICFSCLVLPSASPSITATPSATNTPTPSRSISSTPTISVSSTSTASLTSTASISNPPSISRTATSSISISQTPSRTAAPSSSQTPSQTAAPSSSQTPSQTAAPSVSFSPSPSTIPVPSCPGPYATDDDEAFRIFEAITERNLSDDDDDQTVVNLYFADILNKGDNHDNNNYNDNY